METPILLYQIESILKNKFSLITYLEKRGETEENEAISNTKSSTNKHQRITAMRQKLRKRIGKTVLF